MDKELFLKLANLAKIDCSTSEQEAFLGHLEGMVLSFESLMKIDTDNVASFCGFETKEGNALRDDIVEMTMDPQDFLKNIISKEGMIKLPALLKT